MLRDTKGFTIIELMTTMVIISLLAGIALPKFANTKEQAAIAAMKSDLRNLAAAEETYFVDNLQYSTSVTAIDLRQSENVTVVIPVADVAGWRATATHASTGVTCELYTGTATGASTATEGGVLACS